MPDLFQNFASGVLSAAPGSGSTTLSSGNFAFLPVVASPNTLRLALDPDGLAGTPEIVIVTAHTAAATSCTVTRGAETGFGAGAARAHAVDTVWRMVQTHDSIVALTSAPYGAKGQILAATGVAAASALTVGTNGQFLGADSSTATGLAWATLPVDSVAIATTAQRNAFSGGALFRGRTIFNSDTGAIEVYYGATTLWKPPWGSAWGYLAGSSANSTQAITTSYVGITALGASFTSYASRNYQLVMHVNVNVGSYKVTAKMVDGGGTTMTGSESQITANGSQTIRSFSAGAQFATGNPTVFGHIVAATLGGVLELVNGLSAALYVFDVGPNGNAPAS